MKRENVTAFFVILALSLLLMGRQLLTDGYFSVLIEDTQAFVSWAWQFDQALKSGDIYPRWMPLDFWGYGSPVFVQYPPLAYLITSIVHSLGFSLLKSMNLVKFLSYLFFSYSIFLILRRHYEPKTSLISSIPILCIPFNHFLFYYYGTFSCLFSMMFVPLTILYQLDYLKDGHKNQLLKSGICFGLLIMSHLITAYMFSFLLLAITSIYVLYIGDLKKIVSAPIILIIGGILSSAYLIPLVFERRNIKLENFTRHPTGFDYNDFFLNGNVTENNVNNLFWNTYSGFFSANAIFFLAIAVIFILTYMIKIKKYGESENRPFQLSFFVAYLFTAIMSISASSFLWQAIPYMKYVQFPFRWMTLTLFCAAILLSVSICKMRKLIKSTVFFNFFAGAILIFFLIANYSIIKNSHIFYKSDVLPAKQVNWTFEHLPQKANPEILVNNRPQEERITIQSGHGQTHVIQETPTELTYRVIAETPLTLRVSILAFPGWVAHVDKTKYQLATEENAGLMLLYVDKGKHDLSINFEDTLPRTAGKIISLIAGLITLSCLYIKRNKA